VRRGTLDVALIGLPSKTDSLVVERLAEDPLVAALPLGHRLAARRMISVTELGDDPLFWFNRDLNPAYYDYCGQVFERFGYAPSRVAEPSAPVGAFLALVRATLCAAR
jgi:DNA-binding transcriptional LysR family regulator